MAKVPYKNPVAAINDLSEGRIHAFVGAYAIMRPRMLAGKVKAIALTNLQHAAALPDIPTGKEAGYQVAGVRRPGRLAGAARHAAGGARAHRCGHSRPSPPIRRSSRGSAPPDRWSIRARRPNSPSRARRSARHRGGDRQDAGDQGGAVSVSARQRFLILNEFRARQR